jgi:predicted permease
MKKLLNWFRRGRLENGLDRELSYHIDRRVADLVASGVPEPEARRRAVLELGGLTQVREQVRDVWLTRWLRDFAYDLRFAVRSFLQNPSFTATVVLSLALGIGSTTAIYSLVDQVVLRALPVYEPERLVLVDWKGDQVAETRGSSNLMSYPICLDLQMQDRFFTGVLCRHLTPVNLSIGADPKPATVEIVSGTYFSVLGVGPALGRVLRADDDQPGADPVAVLEYAFWRNQLASAPDVVGRKILINQQPVTVVGVAAETFRGIDVGEVPAVWVPVTMTAQVIPGWLPVNNRRARWMQVLGRLRPGVTASQAQVGLQPWFKAMLEEDARREGLLRITPERRARFLASTIEITPAPQGHSSLRQRFAKPLWVLLSATAVLLSLACLNVAGLFLARGSARDREIKTRMALGASRARVGRQFLADSVFYALLGGSLGVIVAPIVLRTFISFLSGDAVSDNDLQSGVNSRVLLFTLLISTAAGVLSGLAPAFQAGRDSLISSLKERGATAFGSVRLRKVIITVQIAFTLVLLVGAALFVRTLSALTGKGTGFSTSSLVSFGLNPSRNGYAPADASRLVRRIHDDVGALPGTETMAVASTRLLTGGSWANPLTIQAEERFGTGRDVRLNAISPAFFATLGARIVAGRDFEERDSLPSGGTGWRTAIVNEAFVKRYFDGRSPLGARICLGEGPGRKPDTEIVGVVANFNYSGLRDESEQAYFPIFAGRPTTGHFYVRVRGTPEAAFQSIRDAIHAADPSLPITYFSTVDEQVNRSLSTERMLAAVSGGFGTLALLLSLVGVYGVMSFVVTHRTREIGVRIALGASRSSALWLVLRDAIVMIAAGTAIALPCVWALGRLVESQLFGVRPTDPTTVTAATLVLVLTGFGAALVPAYRAAGIDPTEALRFE